MIVVFTDLTAERAGALFTDVLGSSRDASYEGDGIIFSPFCDGSEGTAVYDSRFRPFHLPVAFLFVRHTVLSDWTFFVDDDALLDRWARRFGPAGTAALAQSSAACPGAWRVSNSPGACGVISAGNPELRQAGWRPSRCDAKPRSESVAAARHIERRRSRALLLRTTGGSRGASWARYCSEARPIARGRVARAAASGEKRQSPLRRYLNRRQRQAGLPVFREKVVTSGAGARVLVLAHRRGWGSRTVASRR
jgi:hypothetical protein